jgi:hypothetical protein
MILLSAPGLILLSSGRDADRGDAIVGAKFARVQARSRNSTPKGGWWGARVASTDPGQRRNEQDRFEQHRVELAKVRQAKKSSVRRDCDLVSTGAGEFLPGSKHAST